MVQTITRHLGKVSYAIILLGWRNVHLTMVSKRAVFDVGKGFFGRLLIIVDFGIGLFWWILEEVLVADWYAN